MERPAIAALLGVLGLLMAWAVVDLPSAHTGLHAAVAAEQPRTGLANPVTAVLLDFRAYDTLLEVGVLVLAVLGALVLRPQAGAPPHPAPSAGSPVLRSLAGALLPVMLLTGGYLLWAGTHMAGGAFQAGAILAAAGVLLRLSAVADPASLPHQVLGPPIVLGFVLFLVAGVAVMPVTGVFLDWPPGWSYGLILAIEAGIAVSTAVVLALLHAAAGPPLAEMRRPAR